MINGDYTVGYVQDPNADRKARITNAVAIIFAAGGAERWCTAADMDVLVSIAFGLEAKVSAQVDAEV